VGDDDDAARELFAPSHLLLMSTSPAIGVGAGVVAFSKTLERPATTILGAIVFEEIGVETAEAGTEVIALLGEVKGMLGGWVASGIAARSDSF
jgi:hypothetical protein